MTLDDFMLLCGALAPELILTLTICAAILADMLVPLRHSRAVCHTLALLGVLAALGVVCHGYFAPPVLTDAAANPILAMVRHDGLTRFFQLLFMLGTALAVVFSSRSRELAGYRQGEYYALMLGGTLAASLLVAANDWILFVVALETLSMCSYVLAGFIKHERRSAEAGLKYMLYGAVASGVMLFGISYLYGLSGTLDIAAGMAQLTVRYRAGMDVPAIVFSAILLLTGLGFKMALVPFHFWCPDVYQGAPTPVTAWLSIVSKAAGFGALMRVMKGCFLGELISSVYLPPGDGLILMPQAALGLLAVVTMTWGNLVALRQTDAKRLLAYSSIAHAGYMLMGLAVLDGDAIKAVAAYFFLYLFMNMGAFWVVIVLVNRLGGSELERFRGVARRAPFLFAMLFIFLIALTGLPPTAGIAAKIILFKAVVGAGIRAMGPEGAALSPAALGWFLLALAGMVNSAVSLFYYMKFSCIMAFKDAPEAAPLGHSLADGAIALALAVPTVALIYFAPVMTLVDVVASR
jgi:NADH-quinone oxidoreductase subunit N